MFISDKGTLSLVVNLQLCLFRIRVSFSNEPFHHLGFLNLVNTVSGNCLVSDLEQHAFLVAFLQGVGIILHSLGLEIPLQQAQLHWQAPFTDIPRVSAPVTCHLSPHLLTCWFIDELASQAPPPSEWSVRLRLLLERGRWAEPQWVTTSVKRRCHKELGDQTEKQPFLTSLLLC